MSPILPSQGALASAFVSHHPLSRREEFKPQPTTAPTPRQRSIFPAWSAVDDVKDKAGKLGGGVAKEFDKVSHKAQEKTGKIELYSGKYYMSCIVGGMLACVSIACLFLAKLSYRLCFCAAPYSCYCAL